MIVDLTSNEKAVHGDFYNGMLEPLVKNVFLFLSKCISFSFKMYFFFFQNVFLFIGFVDLCDDDDLL
jgi:hypothetical protein